MPSIVKLFSDQDLEKWPLRVDHPTAKYRIIDGHFYVTVKLENENKVKIIFSRESSHRTGNNIPIYSV